jgi:hypothetical protein
LHGSSFRDKECWRSPRIGAEGVPDVTFRLYGAAGPVSSPFLGTGSRPGTWILLAEGVWQPGQRRCIELPAPGEALRPVDGLRLELYGAGPRLSRVSYRLELAPVSVLFEAAAAGQYVVAFGGISGYHGTAAPQVSGQKGAPWLEPGPLQARPPPPLPSRTTAPGEPLDEAGFGSSFRVEAPGALAGDVVRIEIPAWLYARSPALADLRLVADGREVPYLLWRRGEPMRVAELDGLTLDPRTRRSPKLLLPARDVPLSLALITTYPAIAAQFSLSGEHGEDYIYDSSRCAPQAALPCRRTMNLQGHFEAAAPGPLFLGVGGGGPPPGARCDLSLWRRRDGVVFVWLIRRVRRFGVLAAWREGEERCQSYVRLACPQVQLFEAF